MGEKDFLTIRQIVEIAKKSRMSHDTIREWKSIAKRRRWNELGENIHRIIDGQPAYHVSVLSGRMRKFVQISNPDAEAIKTRRELDGCKGGAGKNPFGNREARVRNWAIMARRCLGIYCRD